MSIIVYRAPNCPWCEFAETFLKKNKIKFKVIDVSKDEKAAKDMIRKSGQMGVPVIDVDGKIIVGFQEAAIKRLLKIK